MARQQDLDAAVKKITGCGIALADRLGAKSGAAAVQPGGKDAGVVENHNIAGAQEIGKVAEVAVLIVAALALQVQHAGTVAGGERPLGDEFGRKVEIEIGDQHGLRLQEMSGE